VLFLLFVFQWPGPLSRVPWIDNSAGQGDLQKGLGIGHGGHRCYTCEFIRDLKGAKRPFAAIKYVLADINTNFTLSNVYGILYKRRSRGSSVSIVSDYGLGDRATEVRSPAEARKFSSNLFVQTSSGAHPAPYPKGADISFLGVMRGRVITLTTQPI
jgi:hypothetical protein